MGEEEDEGGVMNKTKMKKEDGRRENEEGNKK